VLCQDIALRNLGDRAADDGQQLSVSVAPDPMT
jgi:hypothetical protein